MTSAAEKVKPTSQEATAAVGEPSASDAMWAAMMIPHHRTGIAMSELAESRAATDELRQAAQSSKVEQEDDLPRLEEIIRAAGQDERRPERQIEQMAQHHMQVLESLSGTDFDRHWITVVGGHHQAAIMMSETALAGNSPYQAARSLQEQIREKQLNELDDMRNLLQRLGG